MICCGVSHCDLDRGCAKTHQIVAVLVRGNVDDGQARSTSVVWWKGGDDLQVSSDETRVASLDGLLEHLGSVLVGRVLDGIGEDDADNVLTIGRRAVFEDLLGNR